MMLNRKKVVCNFLKAISTCFIQIRHDVSIQMKNDKKCLHFNSGLVELDKIHTKMQLKHVSTVSKLEGIERKFKGKITRSLISEILQLFTTYL